jgi:ABC-2 type transport system permease protein
MKILDIALKDMLRNFRSAFAVLMMFVAPFLITGLIYVAFSGLAGGDNLSLPVTRVVAANLDTPDASTGFAAGQQVIDIIQSKELAEILDVTIVGDETSARKAVDDRQADVAVIVPAGFTQAVMASGSRADVTIYHDPTLTIGPGVVEAVVNGILDGFSGFKITADVAQQQLAASGQTADPAVLQSIAVSYAQWAEAQSTTESAAADTSIALRAPAGSGKPAAGMLGGIFGPVMAGMLVFFVFYTGAVTAQSIIREDEEGTLARLSTTPTQPATILGGKLASVFLMVLVQSIVLLAASALLFKIQWGQPATVTALVIATMVAASGFGILLMSFIKTMQQSGPVLGGVLTICGMLGGTFTAGFTSLPGAFDAATLIVPQGWALRGWKLALAGASLGEVLLPVAALLGMGIVFFAVGTLLFRRRFA